MLLRLGSCRGELARGWRASRCSATSADHVASLPWRNNRPTRANIVVTVTQEELVAIENAGLADGGFVRVRVNRTLAGHIGREQVLGRLVSILVTF
jgi:hypothetical protein